MLYAKTTKFQVSTMAIHWARMATKGDHNTTTIIVFNQKEILSKPDMQVCIPS
jgi:hypothetical protein